MSKRRHAGENDDDVLGLEDDRHCDEPDAEALAPNMRTDTMCSAELWMRCRNTRAEVHVVVPAVYLQPLQLPQPPQPRWDGEDARRDYVNRMLRVAENAITRTRSSYPSIASDYNRVPLCQVCAGRSPDFPSCDDYERDTRAAVSSPPSVWQAPATLLNTVRCPYCFVPICLSVNCVNHVRCVCGFGDNCYARELRCAFDVGFLSSSASLHEDDADRRCIALRRLLEAQQTRFMSLLALCFRARTRPRRFVFVLSDGMARDSRNVQRTMELGIECARCRTDTKSNADVTVLTTLQTATATKTTETTETCGGAGASADADAAYAAVRREFFAFTEAARHPAQTTRANASIGDEIADAGADAGADADADSDADSDADVDALIRRAVDVAAALI